MNRLASHFGRLLVLLVFVVAAWLLYDRLKVYTFGQIREAIATMPPWHIVAASLLTVLNYVILIGYDWLAVRWVGETDLPLEIARWHHLPAMRSATTSGPRCSGHRSATGCIQPGACRCLKLSNCW